MGSKTIRVAEPAYKTIRDCAAAIDAPISETANIIVMNGFSDVDWEQYVKLDSDLIEQLSDAESPDDVEKIYRRQFERNVAGSDLVDLDEHPRLIQHE